MNQYIELLNTWAWEFLAPEVLDKSDDTGPPLVSKKQEAKQQAWNEQQTTSLFAICRIYTDVLIY